MMKTRSEQITKGLRKSFQDTNCKMSNRICYGYAVAENGELLYYLRLVKEGFPEAVLYLK